MTLTQLHQKIGSIQRDAARLGQQLELSDRIADTCGHPGSAEAQTNSNVTRDVLRRLFTRLHHLEARLPTPELMSERAYSRMLMLGFEAEAAEEARRSAYQAATKPARKPYTKRVPILDRIRSRFVDQVA